MVKGNIGSCNPDRLNGIDLLRCIAFLMVFISHCGVGLSIGEGGVSLFLVISGFVTLYSGLRKNGVFETGLRNNFRYAVNKIRDLYILHVVCTLLMSVKLFVGDNGLSFGFIVLKFVLNMLLIQEWFPISSASINGVAWYLCVLFLFYFIYPWINNYFRSCTKKKEVIRNILLLLFAMTIVSVGSRLLLENATLGNDAVFRSNLNHWVVYYFPPVRLMEMLIGCNLAYIYFSSKHIEDKGKYSFLELISMFLLVLSNCIYLNYIRIPDFWLISSNESWWKDSLLYILPSMFSVNVFAAGKGVVSNFLNNKIVKYIADLSRSGFLIHFVVIQYLDAIIERVGYIRFPVNDGLIRTMLYALITVVVCEIWKWCKTRKSADRGRC